MKIPALHIKIVFFSLIFGLLLVFGYFVIRFIRPPIKVGILHSLTGSLALSEKAIVDGELLAIEEINARGGVLGRQIKPIIVDGKSDLDLFVTEAERLITQEKVVAIIGCWASSIRKAVKPVIEKYNSLLIYPTAYEGVEESPNIFYTGATQNQEIVPAALWSLYNLGTKFFLVGSDNIFSRVTNEIVKSTLAVTSAQIVGEEYILVDSDVVQPIISRILEIKPDVIINTLYGSGNLSFFKELRAHNITPEKIPVMTISSVTETEFSKIGVNAMAGDYGTASYFQSIERKENSIFISNFKKKYGSSRVISESVEAGYVSAHIWAQAANTAQSADPSLVRQHLFNQIFNAPSGILYVDSKILHLWKMVYVGRLRSDGQFSIVWDSNCAIEPFIYPILKDKKFWDTFENDLYETWGKRWLKID